MFSFAPWKSTSHPSLPALLPRQGSTFCHYNLHFLEFYIKNIVYTHFCLASFTRAHFCEIHTRCAFIYIFLRWSLALLPRQECSGKISAHHNLCLPGTSHRPVSASQVVGNQTCTTVPGFCLFFNKQTKRFARAWSPQSPAQCLSHVVWVQLCLTCILWSLWSEWTLWSEAAPEAGRPLWVPSSPGSCPGDSSLHCLHSDAFKMIFDLFYSDLIMIFRQGLAQVFLDQHLLPVSRFVKST